MDAETVRQIFRESMGHMATRNCIELRYFMDYVEKTVIEEKKNQLFVSRINFICMAKCFRDVMERDTGCKQVRRFLKRDWGWDDDEAKKTADKMNEARRVYDNIESIMSNCMKCDLDIRDLSLKELYLATNLSWTYKRKSQSRTRGSVPENAPITYNHASMAETFAETIVKDWFVEAQGDPQMITNMWNIIGTQLINYSIHYASRN